MDSPRPFAVKLAVVALAGDLAKRAIRLQATSEPAPPEPHLDTLIALVKAAGGRCEHDLADAEARDVARSFRPTAGLSQQQQRRPD